MLMTMMMMLIFRRAFCLCLYMCGSYTWHKVCYPQLKVWVTEHCVMRSIFQNSLLKQKNFNLTSICQTLTLLLLLLPVSYLFFFY